MLTRSVGLEVNITKAKAMRVHNKANHRIVDGCAVQFVESFCCLDSMLTTDGGAKEAVNCRLNNKQSTGCLQENARGVGELANLQTHEAANI